MEHWFPLPGSHSKTLRMRYANAQPAAKVAITVGRGQPARGRGVLCAGCQACESAASRRDGQSAAWPGALVRWDGQAPVSPPTRSMAATAHSGYRRRGSRTRIGERGIGKTRLEAHTQALDAVLGLDGH